MQSPFKKLYTEAKNRFKKEYFAFGYNEKDFISLEKSMGPGGSPGNMMIFNELTTNLLLGGKLDQFEKLDPLVRTFQALDNHFPFIYEGQELSGLILGAMQNNHYYGRKVPNDWNAYIQLIYEAHKAIDECFESHKKARLKGKMAMIKRSASIFKDQKDIDDFLKDDFHDQSLPTCHHVLDWYAQLDAPSAYKKTPHKLAAMAIKITMEINWQATRHYPFYMDNHFLGQFAGYSSSSSISSSITPHIYIVLYGVGDLGLLLVDGINAPDDWRKKLRKFAPDIKGKVADFIEDMNM